MNKPLCILYLAFYHMKSVIQKKKKNSRKNAEFIFPISCQTVICETYSCNLLIQTVFCGSNFCGLGPKSQK